MKIINFKKKKMRLLTKEQQQSYENAKICYIFNKKFENKYLKDKVYYKVRDNCHYTWEYRSAAHSICNVKYILFYHKRVSKRIKKNTCLREKTEKYITFTVPVGKEVKRINKNGEEIAKICLKY